MESGPVAPTYLLTLHHGIPESGDQSSVKTNEPMVATWADSDSTKHKSAAARIPDRRMRDEFVVITNNCSETRSTVPEVHALQAWRTGDRSSLTQVGASLCFSCVAHSAFMCLSSTDHECSAANAAAPDGAGSSTAAVRFVGPPYQYSGAPTANHALGTIAKPSTAKWGGCC